MAQEPAPVARGRALVLDPTILLRAVLGPRVRSLFERYSKRGPLLIPAACVEEVREYLPALCAKRGWPTAPAVELLDALLGLLHVIDTPLFAEFEADARRRIGARSGRLAGRRPGAHDRRAGVDRGHRLLRLRSRHLDHRERRGVSRRRVEASFARPNELAPSDLPGSRRPLCLMETGRNVTRAAGDCWIVLRSLRS